MADIRVHAFEATLEDPTDPVPGTPTGPAVASAAHKGVESVSFTATDTGSGVYRAIVEVKRAGGAAFEALQTEVLDPNGGKCVDAGADSTTAHEFVYRVPCKLSVSATLDVDTTTLPDGEHELRLRVEDASGNSALVHGPAPFVVDNVPAPAVTDPDGGGPADGSPSIAGEPVVGNTLVGDRGTWSGDGVTFAQRWLRCSSATDAAACSPIGDATGTQRALTAEDVGSWLRFEVTATNGQGSATALSAAKGPVTAAGAGAGTDTDSGSGSGSGGGGSPSGGGSGADVPGGGSPGGALGTPSNGANASNRAVFALKGKRRRTLRFGQTAKTSVTLRDENGRPISGAQVAVLERMTVPGATWTPARTPLTTDGSGRLRYAIPAKYGRTIRFAYKANLANTEFQSTSDLVLTVRSKTTLKPSRTFLRNGQAVRFSGRVLSRPVPATGVLIDMQAKVGRKWQTFRTARSKRNGKWSVKYRFRATRGLQKYTFRARVRRDTGFPYAASTSRKTKVRVAG